MQLKLSNSDRQEDTSSDDHNVAVASKLGIVKLGKVAGKVFLHIRSNSSNYLWFIRASPLSKFHPICLLEYGAN